MALEVRAKYDLKYSKDMTQLRVEKREEVGKKAKKLRREGILPAVLYGPKVKNLNLKVSLREFERAYREAGEGSLISLEVEGEKEKFSVLIHEVQLDPLTDKPIHIDFYQPLVGEEIETTVPLVFEGVAPAVKNLGGTLIKSFSEIEVKAKPRDIPREIKVDVSKLETFEDVIKISDLLVTKEVKVLREGDEIVAQVLPPEEVEEEEVKEKKEEVPEVTEEKEGKIDEKKTS